MGAYRSGKDEPIGRVGLINKVIEVSPTVDTSAYADGDHLGTVMTLTDACRIKGGECIIDAVDIIDIDDQKSAMSVLFFDESPTVASSDNEALNISDAELQGKYIGKIEIAAANYKSLADNAVGSVSDQKIIAKAITGSTNLYAIIRCGGSPTYASTSSLAFRFKITQD